MKILRYIYNPEKKGVFRVSIVKNPAVGEGDLVLMSAQEIKGVFYAPVMIPDLKIDRIDESTGEKYQVYYDSDTVEQLANNYFKQCGNGNTNLDHEIEGIEGVYPVESWIVKDPENDKSKALGMPLQKSGTWIMGYKCDSPEILEKIKNNLLQGLSIEGQLDSVEEMNVKFNKSIMSKPLLEALTDLKAVIMSAISGEEKPADEKTPEELAAEEEAKKMASEEEEAAAKKAAEEAAAAGGAEPSDAEKELAALKAENEDLKKKVSDLEAELATFKNDAVLMSAQLVDVQKAFEGYKAIKMSSQKLGDVPVEKVILTPIQEKQANFLKDVQSKLA